MDAHMFLLEDALGTDYAIHLGRNMHCARVPLSQEQLHKAVDFLNSLNTYARTEKDYQWSGIYNNCTHTTHNALAAAGIWEEYAIDSLAVRQIFNLAIPENDFASLIKRGNDLPLEDPLAIYRDPILRKNIMEKNWLPAMPGVLANFTAIKQNNEVFSKDLDALVLEGQLTHTISKNIATYVNTPRYTDLLDNLKYFKARYEKIQNMPFPSFSNIGIGNHNADGIDTVEFAKFFATYKAYLHAQLEYTNQLLEKISN